MPDNELFAQEEQHPSYGMLGFHRVTHGSLSNLFGSSIRHKDTIRLTLKEGKRQRSLNQDWYHGGRELFEVEMSYNQFAELITSMNVGDGIPVTIRRVNGSALPEPPFTDKGEQHLEEYREHLQNTYQNARELIQQVSELFASKKSFSKKEQEKILRQLSHIASDIGANQDFQLKQFQEQMERTATEAKGEIEAFAQHRMLQIAQGALVEELPDATGAASSSSTLLEAGS